MAESCRHLVHPNRGRRLRLVVGVVFVLGFWCHTASSFVVAVPAVSSRMSSVSYSTRLFLAKKKRRRKVPPTTTTTKRPDSVEKPSSSAAPQSETAVKETTVATESASATSVQVEPTEQELEEMRQIANFAFESDGAIDASEAPTDLTESKAIPLPDIRQARKMKQQERALREKEEEEKTQKPKIKRSDTDAFQKLLERQPFADADDSFFVEEEYGTVSALLGERAKPFLGIPLGPLQAGHLIGALGIILMATVEYPGFPLTNLPTPLRECFQGGLLTVYTINTVLAVVAAFKAPERGQPVPLWVAKTLAVGGLAYDQLMQLPTTKELDRAKAVKGKRAIKKR